MEGIFRLEGLWNIVSGLRPLQTPTAASTTATAGASSRTRYRNSAAISPTGGSDDIEIDQWLDDASRASITLKLSLADEQMFSRKKFRILTPMVDGLVSKNKFFQTPQSVPQGYTATFWKLSSKRMKALRLLLGEWPKEKQRSSSQNEFRKSTHISCLLPLP